MAVKFNLSNGGMVELGERVIVITRTPNDYELRARDTVLLNEITQLSVDEERATFLTIRLRTREMVTVVESLERDALRAVYRALTDRMEAGR